VKCSGFAVIKNLSLTKRLTPPTIAATAIFHKRMFMFCSLAHDTNELTGDGSGDV
jgi:hypothetical protein